MKSFRERCILAACAIVTLLGIWGVVQGTTSVRKFYLDRATCLEVHSQYHTNMTPEELCIATILQWTDACRDND